MLITCFVGEKINNCHTVYLVPREEMLTLHIRFGMIIIWYREQGSSVSIVSGYGSDDQGSIAGTGERIFPLDSVWAPPSLLYNG
jgi:hypothetical protein